MASDIIYIHDQESWPDDLLKYLNENRKILYVWEKNHSNASEYDSVIIGLKVVLYPYFMHGYHCTRLTEEEISYIISNGMSLTNGALLNRRIKALEESGLINSKIAIRLMQENQANDTNRAGMIWFCFFPPYIAGQSRIERFFRSWGGEALYNSHEKDVETGKILTRIGIPCIVEAKVVIQGLNTYSGLYAKFAMQYLINCGVKVDKPSMHEGNSKLAIPPQDILRIYKYPDPEFVSLTKCDLWDKSISTS